ncbi:MAG: hypothetical protein P8125_13595 [Gemmatimonadota bacterium]
MNWEALGAIAELLGAAAVVVSLLYVATQVRESTRQARRDATRDLAARISDVSLAVATNPELGDLLVQGGADPAQLSRGDQARFRGLMNSLFRGLEQQFLLRQEGALDDESWLAVERLTHDFAALPGVQTYLLDRGRWYTEGFLAYVWALVGGPPEGDGKSLVEHYSETLDPTAAST